MCIVDCFSGMNLTIQNYSHKPEVRYIHTRTRESSGEIYFDTTRTDHGVDYLPSIVKATEGFIPMGVELEVEHISDNEHGLDRHEATEEAIMDFHRNVPCLWNDIDDVVSQLVIAKTDGSLNHGVEFVTQPLTLKAHQQLNWNATQNKGFYAWNASTAGMHIHVPKSYYTTTQTWLLLKLYQSLWNNNTDWFNWIAGRTENSWAKRNLPHRIDATNSLLAVASTKYDDRRDRYSALSFQNPYTIEHRFFRSNMNEDGLMSRLEYIQATYDFVVVLSRLEKADMFDAISKGLGKQLHMFICANSNEYKKLAHRLLNTNKFGVESGYVSRSEVIPSLINGLDQARKEA